MTTHIVIQWGPSSFFGWGVYGLNLGLAWAGDPELVIAYGSPVARDQIALDGLRMRRLDAVLASSAELGAQLMPRGKTNLTIGAVVLAALGNDFRMGPAVHGGLLAGEPSIGVTFFESTPLDAEAVARARQFPLIITGSTWNERILRACGIERVATVLQGIDPTLFHPAPRSGYFGDRFLVFSGGKLERRKGQDLVLAAFVRFARSHPDALLVTAWHSPWPALARSLDASGLAAPVPFRADGSVDATRWATESGLPPHQFVDLGSVPNAAMAPILREMDCAVFPNRGEGGTNLVAMECMASGVPTILSANTGHLDLIGDDCCYALASQAPVIGEGAGVGDVEGWGESSVDEIIESLERAYSDRADARRRGARGAARLAPLTWKATADAMKRHVLAARGIA